MDERQHAEEWTDGWRETIAGRCGFLLEYQAAGLSALRTAPDVDVIYDVPSRLADGLASGHLDVGLIPSIESFQCAEYRIVSDACIACRGPVLSVKLFSRVPIEQVQSVALDAGSRTSAALVRILLQQRFGLSPELCPLPLDADILSSPADAVLLIGDRAIRRPPRCT